MKTFQTACATLLGVVVLGFIALAAGIYTGSNNVAANDHHWPITYWALDKTVQNSVAARGIGLNTAKANLTTMGQMTKTTIQDIPKPQIHTAERAPPNSKNRSPLQ